MIEVIGYCMIASAIGFMLGHAAGYARGRRSVPARRSTYVGRPE